MRHKKRLIFITAVIVLIYFWPTLNMFLVATRAAATAGNDPYCIQGARDKNLNYRDIHYKPITALHELWGLHAECFDQGQGDHCGQFYFLLIVDTPEGRKFYNWSNRQQNFDLQEDFLKRFILDDETCVPTKDYVKNLPW